MADHRNSKTMPNPKDYVDDDHTYVKGYVRRKHIEPTPSEPSTYYEESRSVSSIFKWTIHIAATVTALVMAFTPIPTIGIALTCTAFPILLVSLIVRIHRWRRNRYY